MGRRAILQVTMTKGELDPDLSERVDLEHYYDSLASAPNSIFHPQGGCSDRGGFTLISDADVLAAGTARRLRRRIVPVLLTAVMITAANGGTPANLVDQSSATSFVTNAMTLNPFVILEIDLGTATTIDMIDVEGFSAELAASDYCLAVEWWTGAAWATFADPTDAQPAKHIRTGARTRRFATSPGGPGGTRVSARNWRLVARTGAGVTGRISIKGLRLWAETPVLSPIDVREVAREVGASYELVFTERNIDVFDVGRYVASIPAGIAAEQVDEIWCSAGFDTLIAYHEMLEPVRVIRQGSASEWDVDAAPFTDVPNLRQQIIFTGDQDEIQRITFAGLVAGDVLWLGLGGLVAGPIVFANAAALPGQVLAALAGLPGLGSGLVVSGSGTGPTLEIRFAGAIGARAWPLLSVMTASAAVAATTTVAQPGLKSTGKLFSAETGWPSCGSFVQSRIVVAGFRAAPTSFMLARPDSWSMLDTTSPMTADLAMLRTLNVDGIERIRGVFMGRHLQIFTEQAEWYVTAQVFDATQPFGLTRATGHGIKRATPIAFADGGSLFVQEGGQTLRDFLWTDTQQSYSAEPLTVLSPQILTDVIDVAHRNARSVTEGNLIVLVNRDGTAGCLTLLRGQNVIAGSPWSTRDGAFRAAMVDVAHRLWVVTERAGAHWLERWTPDMPLDFATSVSGSGLTAIAGAHHLEGRADVYAVADNELLGPFTVTGGSFALGMAADQVTYGLMPDWRARLQVIRSRISAEQPFRPPGRIYEAELALKKTGHITIGTNGAAHREVPLLRMGDHRADGGPLEAGGDPGLPMFERLYTGNVRIGGLIGFSRTPYLELGRTLPAPVHVKAVRLEIVMKAEA